MSMGKRVARLNPTISGRVNRHLVERAIPIVKRAVYSIDEPWKYSKRGRHPTYTSQVLVCLLVLGAILNLGYNEMESVLNGLSAIKEVFGPQLPSHSTYHRAANRLSMGYINVLNKALVESHAVTKRAILLVDSTGFRLKKSSTWFDIRIKRKSRRKDHLKLHIMVSHKLGLIYSFAVTKAYSNDSPIFHRLIAGLSLKYFILCGDSGYLSRINCKLVGKKNGLAFFSLKKNTTAKGMGVKEWYEMVMLFRKMPWGFLLVYHLRSYVESTIGAIKQRFGHQIYSRKGFMQKRELGLKVVAHNVKQLLYIQESESSNLPLWVYEDPIKGAAKQNISDAFIEYCFTRNH